ncbi:unnamed protein product, partial [Rotaria sp. Silwood2]
TCFESQQQSSISKTESVLQANVNSDDEETATLLPSPDQTAATFVTKSPKSSTENSDHFIVSLDSSNNDDMAVSEGDADTFIHEPVVKGEITTGTSTRNGKMIFMNGFSYLYMSTAKETIGWRCIRRNVNCRAVIHTLKTTGEFSRWNGVFHSHTFDPNETRKREILESGLHKTRRRALPPVPHDQKFVVPPVYLETYSKERFLIYDKRKSQYGGRLMMFASPEQLDVLFHSDILFLPETLVTGCWFHFCQSCYLNIQQLGLMKVYDTDAEARHLLRAFMGLALLPMNLIRDGFIVLKKKVKASCHRDQLELNKRSLIDTIMSFAYLVGEPVARGRKENKNKNSISKSDSSSPSSSIIDSD